MSLSGRLSVMAAIMWIGATCSGLVGAVEAQEDGRGKAGILVMAHGGIPEWDQAVVEAVEPLKPTIPIALALGMADPTTMQAALDSLQSQGVETVAVVRLFLSGESFLHDTEFYLGLREDAPAMPMAMMMHGSGHGDHEMGPIRPLDRTADILLEMRGLAEIHASAEIVGERARAVSTDPGSEAVILVAHGMGDEGENQRLLDQMRPSLEVLRSHGFSEVEAATLREDWPEARQVAEAEIREWVSTRAENGKRVIVVPFRLFGFGGYDAVLEGLSYAPADGLLPHPLITEWIEESAGALFCSGGVDHPLGECG